eukprot:TRINITY_DN2789_c0_g1_i1.p2 TRINITY_DN2789_c0_g1~~TRINITY_DN2789_c0_g1_i1.p2  ORF type:complete len:145 (+),score=39.22 TRINITY_DN2789_c0_g1_i1:38-436(+)
MPFFYDWKAFTAIQPPQNVNEAIEKIPSNLDTFLPNYLPALGFFLLVACLRCHGFFLALLVTAAVAAALFKFNVAKDFINNTFQKSAVATVVGLLMLLLTNTFKSLFWSLFFTGLVAVAHAALVKKAEKKSN